MSYIYLLSAIVCEVFATTFLKAANGFTVLLPSLAVALGYGGAFYFLSLSLSGIQLGTAYAIWSGLGIVLVSVAAYFVYHQKPDAPAIAGMALIICGVLVIRLFLPQETMFG